MTKTAEKNPANKYSGRFVAIPSFKEKRVIAYGKKPADVYKTSEKRGVKSPVVFFIPEKDTSGLY